MSESTISFIQYQFCTICRLNHKQGSKHVYSKTHKDKLNLLIDRFRAKTAPVVRAGTPIINDEYWENGKNFWCYFCDTEAARHMKLGSGTVQDGGIMEHLSTTEHKQKTEIFWRLNKISAEKKTQFIVDEEDFNSFKMKAVIAVKRYEEKMQSLKTMERQNLERLEQRAWEVGREDEIQSHRPTPRDSDNHQTGNTSRYRKTVLARGEGLTSIDTSPDEDGVGNVHTGATPPWLISDDCEPSTSGEIGPSMKDFEKHLAAEAKRKLPATRVGAGFNRNEPTSSSWLPSFGQVWNHGRRSNTKESFLRREKKGSHSARIPPPKRMKYTDMTS